MTVFRLKQFASTSAHAAAGAIRWNYDRAELIADGIVHGIGVLSGVIAATVLIVLAAGVAPQMAAAALRSFRDLHPDRRDLYAGVRPVAGSCVCDVAVGRRLECG